MYTFLVTMTVTCHIQCQVDVFIYFVLISYVDVITFELVMFNV